MKILKRILYFSCYTNLPKMLNGSTLNTLVRHTFWTSTQPFELPDSALSIDKFYIICRGLDSGNSFWSLSYHLVQNAEHKFTNCTSRRLHICHSIILKSYSVMYHISISLICKQTGTSRCLLVVGKLFTVLFTTCSAVSFLTAFLCLHKLLLPHSSINIPFSE